MNGKRKTLPEAAFISIGSNIDPEKYLPLAVENLSRLGEQISVSLVYQNPAIARPEQSDYLNAAAHVVTANSALEIRGILRQIEESLGRIRSKDKYDSRTLDLDLCLLGDQVLETAELILPDPNLLKYAHIAVPIAELDPDFLHPIAGSNLREIAYRLRPEANLSLREDISQRIREVAANATA